MIKQISVHFSHFLKKYFLMNRSFENRKIPRFHSGLHCFMTSRTKCRVFIHVQKWFVSGFIAATIPLVCKLLEQGDRHADERQWWYILLRSLEKFREVMAKQSLASVNLMFFAGSAKVRSGWENILSTLCVYMDLKEMVLREMVSRKMFLKEMFS